ncbi:MAG: hypothetical protein DKT66_19635 [Candidatus Melainabacteria bacterium]|nr:MAG: hypothetical protein DKT66_19635 [Candidatus Melainabacteria bacterium]
MLREMQESPKENVVSTKDNSNLDEYRCFSPTHPPSSAESKADEHLPPLIFDKEHLEFHNMKPDQITINPDVVAKVEKPNVVYDETALAMTATELMMDGSLDKDGDGRVSKQEIVDMFRLAVTDDSVVNPELTKQTMMYMLGNYESIEDESDDEWFDDDEGITLNDLKDNQTRIADGDDFKSGFSKFGEGMLDLFTVELWPFRAKTYT